MLVKDHLPPPQNQQVLRQRIEQIVSRITRIDVSELIDDVLIREELGIDSLKGMEILSACENEFRIELDEGQFACIDTVGNFFAMVMHAMKGQ